VDADGGLGTGEMIRTGLAILTYDRAAGVEGLEALFADWTMVDVGNFIAFVKDLFGWLASREIGQDRMDEIVEQLRLRSLTTDS
jgi:hypothetical protein